MAFAFFLASAFDDAPHFLNDNNNIVLQDHIINTKKDETVGGVLNVDNKFTRINGIIK